MQINIHEAKTQFSKLILCVERGEEVIIARYGQPVAKLVPYRRTSVPRIPGSAEGRFTVPPEFFEPLPEDILDAFEK